MTPRRFTAQLDYLTFFLDYQIGRFVVAEALRAAGARVEVHIDHFEQNAPDTDWIPEIGQRQWVLITKDQNIRRNPLERAAYKGAQLRGFVVTQKDMSGLELASLLVRALPGMVRRAAGRRGPLLCSISRSGVFSKLL
ncbi:MAG: PIN-like domain-containing protein [Burkholderiales bacterium]